MQFGLKPEEFWDLTLREYIYIRRGYEYNLARQWDMTAALLSLHANINSGRGKRFSPADFHPLMDVSSPRDHGITTQEEREALFAKLKKF